MARTRTGDGTVERVEQDLLEYGTGRTVPKMEGRQLMRSIAPKKKKSNLQGTPGLAVIY